MPSSELIRWSGLAAILAAVLLSVGALLNIATETENLSESATTAPYAFTWLLYLLGGVLLLLGLVGLYARQSEAAGILGLVGWLDSVRHSYAQSPGLPASSRHTPHSRGVDQLPTHSLHRVGL